MYAGIQLDDIQTAHVPQQGTVAYLKSCEQKSTKDYKKTVLKVFTMAFRIVATVLITACIIAFVPISIVLLAISGVIQLFAPIIHLVIAFQFCISGLFLALGVAFYVYLAITGAIDMVTFLKNGAILALATILFLLYISVLFNIFHIVLALVKGVYKLLFTLFKCATGIDVLAILSTD